MRYIFLIIVLISFVSGLDIELDCPSSVFAGEEFSCSVEVSGGEARYDLKVEVDEERDSVLDIMDEGEWKSSYYYLNDFVKRDAEVVLKFGEAGRYDFVVKLRDGDFREEFDCGRIRVLDNVNKSGEETTNYTSYTNGNLEEGVIVLNLVEEVVLKEEVVFVSKEGRVVDMLPYLFCVFLILLIGILVWERF